MKPLFIVKLNCFAHKAKLNAKIRISHMCNEDKENRKLIYGVQQYHFYVYL